MIQKNILTNSEGQQLLNEDKVDSAFSIIGYSIKEFLNWWYIKMTFWHLRMLGRVGLLVDDNMSISLLLKHFFLPWHRDYSVIGYVFGILIKLIYLPFAILSYILLCLSYISLIIVWLLLPIATIFFILSSLLSL